MMYTSRYTNPELTANPDKYSVVRISVGYPRFLKYKLAGTLKALAPVGYHKLTDKKEFRRRYVEQLETLGVEQIEQMFKEYEQEGKTIVLCCYEDVRKGGENWCHRTMLADWWEYKTGETIEELKDPTAYKLELPSNPFMAIFNSI